MDFKWDWKESRQTWPKNSFATTKKLIKGCRYDTHGKGCPYETRWKVLVYIQRYHVTKIDCILKENTFHTSEHDSRTVSYLTAHKATTKCKQWIKHNSFGACLISLPKKNLSSIHSFQAFLPQQLKTSRSNQITHWALNLAIDMLGVGVRFWQVAGWKCLNWILHADSNSGSGETRFNRVKCENE